MNKYTMEELRQRQNLPLDAKIAIAKRRIIDWNNSWTRFNIRNQATGNIRYTTNRSADEVKLRKNEVIESSGGANIHFLLWREGLNRPASFSSQYFP